MTNDNVNTNTDATSGNVDQHTTETKGDNMVPSYRLREEAEKRRTAERELEALKSEKQAAMDKDLSYKEKFEKLQTEYTGFKTSVAKQQVESQFISKAKDLGFPEKIAKLGVPKDITEDNVDDRLKEFVKEYKEFLPAKEDKKADTTPMNPFAAMQPKQEQTSPNKFSNPGLINGQDVMNDLLKTTK